MPLAVPALYAQSNATVLQIQDGNRIQSLDFAAAETSPWFARKDWVADPARYSIELQTRSSLLTQSGSGWQRTAIPSNLYGSDETSLFSEPATGLRFSYALVFQIPQPLTKNLALRLGRINDRNRVYLNGHLIGADGEFGSEFAQSYDKIRLYEIPPGILALDKPNALVVIAESYTPDEVGIVGDRLEIGPLVSMVETWDFELYREFGFLIAYLTVGMYFLFLFLRRRADRENLFFALFITAMVAYQALVTQVRFLFDFEFYKLKRIEYLILYTLIPFFFLFVRNYFDLPRRRWRQVMDFLALAASAVTAFFWFYVLLTSDANMWWYTQKNIVQPLWLVYMISIIVILFYSGFRGDHDAWFMLLGFCFVLVGVALDILSNRGLINIPRMMSFLFSAFIFSLALVLANRFVRLHSEVEDLNANLEHKVIERTEQLNESLTRVRSLKEQQDGDYFLTSLLIKPLSGNFSCSTVVHSEILIHQKKAFKFRKWDSEIGGDICMIYDLELSQRRYTVFLNGDAMGKSIQGAGGALVLGTVFKSLVTRTHVTRARETKHPEQWIRECILELQNVFTAFDGSMLISVVLGLIDEASGTLYYVNSEHPRTVLFRENKARFLDESDILYKIGVPGLEKFLRIKTLQLQPDDVVVCGSDGRDDLQIDVTSKGERVINEDETLFLSVVEQSRADLHEIQQNLARSGQFTDDLSLIRIGYREDASLIDQVVSPHYTDLIKRARELESSDPAAAIKAYEEAFQLDENDADMIYAYASFLRKQKEFGRSLELFQKYTELKPVDPNGLVNTAIMLRKTHDFKRAVDYGERVRLREPGRVDNLLHLADSYRVLKQTQRSRQICAEVQAVDPHNETVVRILERLQQD
ncbi:MAG: SpoIIE family protein phosphatase [Leptospiraceae bacterium]|nr:SpoIIE family protein phosphatase [Leptospiraceae bacterium]